MNYKIAQELTDKISRLRLPFYSSLNDTVNNSESLEAYNMVVANAAKMTDIRELWNYLKTVQHVSMALPGLELADKECPVAAANSMAVERIEKILNGVGIK